jgi:hypothetical protein
MAAFSLAARLTPFPWTDPTRVRAPQDDLDQSPERLAFIDDEDSSSNRGSGHGVDY